MNISNNSPTEIRGLKFWLLIIFSLSGLIIGSKFGYDEVNSGNNSKKEIQNFESALKNYLIWNNDPKNNRNGLFGDSDRMILRTFSDPNRLPSLLEPSVLELSYKNREIALVKINQAIKEFNEKFDPYKGIAYEVQSESFQPKQFQEWNTKRILKGMIYGILWGLIGSISGSLLIVILFFIIINSWHFFLERLKEISRAIKG